MQHEHEELARRLGETEGTLETLVATGDPNGRRAIMQRLAVFFTTALSEHARWEQQGPYPFIDRWAPGGVQLTTALRYEHEIMDRRAAALDEVATAENPDVRAFVRLAYGLTGLARAHLEVEDRVLVPLLEQAARDFEREMHRASVPHDPPPR
jgi:hemerythrin-like domain-containing protein